MNPLQKLADRFDAWVIRKLREQDQKDLTVAQKEYKYLMQKPQRSERDFRRIKELEKIVKTK